MRKKTKIGGVTLLEMIVVMILVGILASSISIELSQGLRSYFTSTAYMQGDWQARTAIERLMREVRSIASGSGITNVSTTNLTFTDVYGNSTSFYQSGSQIFRNDQVLADSIQNLEFNYYDRNGTITAVNTSVCYITVNVVVNNQNYVSNLSTAIYPWNLK